MQSRCLLFNILLFFCPVTVQAAETDSMGSMLGKTIWALLVVVGLILVLYALVRKKIGYGNPGANTIHVIEIRPIVPKNTLALIEIRGKELLIGISSNGMHLLADLSVPAKERPFQEVLREKQCSTE